MCARELRSFVVALTLVLASACEPTPSPEPNPSPSPNPQRTPRVPPTPRTSPTAPSDHEAAPGTNTLIYVYTRARRAPDRAG